MANMGLIPDSLNCDVHCRLGRQANVDTSHFRLATWNYIHLVFGIYHDDYLYTEVRMLAFLCCNICNPYVVESTSAYQCLSSPPT